MSLPGWLQRPIGLALVLSFSCSTWGADSSLAASAMLFASGKVRINGAESQQNMALFNGDSVQTDQDSVANITAGGSSVLVLPGTSLKLMKNLVELDGGGVAITTTEAMSTRADDLIITPASLRLSKFEVAESEELIVVAARQGDVILVDGMEMATIPEGQQRTRRRKRGAAAAGGGHILSGKTLGIIAGGAAAVAIIGVIVTQGGGHQPCISPAGQKPCD